MRLWGAEELKLVDFKNELRSSVEKICISNGWAIADNKQRGMAFEDWCFQLLSDKHPTADVDKSEAILRTDDGGNDIIFESADTQEAYVVQCKYPFIAQTKPMPEDKVKEFFSNFDLLRDASYIKERKGKNQRLFDLSNELKYWIKENWTVYFIFITTDTREQNVDALVDAYNSKFSNSAFNVRFDAWGINELRDVYVEVESVTEQYPDLVQLTLADNHYMQPAGKLPNITFSIRGTELQRIAKKYKESLFNWNIRKYLGKKGEVNKSILKTIDNDPEDFYYYNNGISALCEEYLFSEQTKTLSIRKMQVVNGAQTIGALQISSPEKLKDVFVLVKLTQVKHFSRETGVAAELIRTNNTQNKLSIPDFRSNDKIQIWLEHKFREAKSRGDFLQVDYGRKKPYPRSSINKQVIKLQELGKIRYAWLHNPRIPISQPADLFIPSSEGGLYGYAFGADGAEVDLWTDDQFKDTLLAIHAFSKLSEALHRQQEMRPDLKQITRLRYYALNLFKKYLNDSVSNNKVQDMEDIYKFGAKFNSFYSSGEKLILVTLSQAYKEILNREEGTAFSLPRDQKVWDLVQGRFFDNLQLARDLQNN